jgi:hypothetical protein
MSVRNLRTARTSNNFAVMCEPPVYVMWGPRRITTLWASIASYRDCYTFYRYVDILS